MSLALINSYRVYKSASVFIALLLWYFLIGCGGSQTNNELVNTTTQLDTNIKIENNSIIQLRRLNSGKTRQKIKLGHSINTAANEYLPISSSDGNTFYFSAMDRTGFFDFKLDFIKEKSAGGEDIFVSNFKEGIWEDARPLTFLNTNGHEVVSQVFREGDLLITGNYPENLGVKKDNDAGVQMSDLFFVRKLKSKYQINHLPEPVNSIFTEADGWMAEDQSYILFVSDRPGHVGDYHKKGWKWNESFWGNTDVYVSLKEGDYWSVPINLGNKINTPFAERTPWLSENGLTLYLSSNGYVKGKTDLDVYAFNRKSLNDWSTWDGPFLVEDANTLYDDWGYKEKSNGDAFVASASKIGFKPTQGGVAGDGGVRQTNYRPGYELHGLQVASLDREFETNIYQLQNIQLPSFTASDLFFDFNSSKIKKSFERYLLLLVDQIKQNKESDIEIIGYTDNVGKTEHNLQLSKKRADAVREFLALNGVSNIIVCKGFGAQNPAFPNTTESNRQKNRRIEVFIKSANHD
jgi:outer membrane protein OmpA-like peptidoglycan-associated protein